MEQVPHWLMATVFAAGMTAYAEEVDALSARGIAAEPDVDNGAPIADSVDEPTPPEPPETLH